MKIKRRAALRAGGAAALGAFATACGADKREAAASPSVAPLATPVAVKRRLTPDPLQLLALPEGFRVQLLQSVGERMSDGYRVPGRPDAMACFAAPDGSWILMRNHELLPFHFEISAYDDAQLAPPEAYDQNGLGGVSRLVLDSETLQLKSSNLVLTGTVFNCSGGISPWGFLSCEESVSPGHGFVFLCATDAAKVAAPRRIEAYGRMNHEAASVDPQTSIAYLTEDRPDACFYRFVPRDPHKPFEGRLQALRIKERPRADTAALSQGARVAIDWVDLPSPAPDDDSIRAYAQERGAAIFRRGEGMWLSGRDVFFSATIGGALQRGQIFRLHQDKATLEVIAEGNEQNLLDMPDNLTVSPHGLLYVCEDGPGGNSLRTLSLDGRLIEFARYLKSASELAGACFSPDGRVLFVNAQEDGLTLAITGPFEREAEIHAHAARELDRDFGTASFGSGLACLALAALTRARERR